MADSEEVADLEAVVGATQHFECQVIGYPLPVVTWYKDDTEITQNPRYNITFDADHGVITLVIRNVTATDEGSYLCRAENSEGVASTASYLVVKADTRGPRFYEGFSSAMTVEKLSEEEISQIQILKSTGRTVIEEVITRVEESDKEEIWEKLIVPRITFHEMMNEEIVTKVKGKIYIEVDISGFPQPAVAWLHGDTQLTKSSRVNIGVDTDWSCLKIRDVTAKDAGKYSVTAENKAGMDKAEFTIIVKSAPSTPCNLRVLDVYKNYVVLGWEAPLCDGGVAIIGYQVDKSLVGGNFVSAGYATPNELQFKVTKLHEGNQYMFQVSAENRIGLGEPVRLEKAVTAKLPFDPPDSPSGLRVTDVYKDFLTIDWEAPKADGGSPITQYVIEKLDATRPGASWMVAGTVEASVLSYKVSKLFQGNAYLLRVAAENRVGMSEPIELERPVIAKLPFDQPEKPQNLCSIDTNRNYVVIQWDAPQNDGGTPITSYIIEKRDAKRQEYFYLAELPADTLTYKAVRLFEGNEYYFRVIAENEVGPSEPCELQQPVKAKLPYDEPCPPCNLRVTDYWSEHITIAWDAPKNDGGSPITSYVIEKRDAARQMWLMAGTVGPEVMTFKIGNLFEGVDYHFRVFAENEAGLSASGVETEKPITAKMPFDPPSAPANLSVIDFNTDYITVTWDMPQLDGGSPILRYIVEKRDAMMTMYTQAGKTDPQTCSLKVDGLFSGHSYLVRVAAENQRGRGEFVETGPVTARLPYGCASAPRNVRTTEIWRDFITISWDEPETDGGSPLTGYAVECRDSFESSYRLLATVKPDTTTYTAKDLQEGRDYYLLVFSQNAAGLSEQPAELLPAVKARLPFELPSSTRDLRVTGTGGGTISIEWEAPDSDGGSPITGYIIEVCHSTGTTFTTAGSVMAEMHHYVIKELLDGGEYNVRVVAQNITGVSKEGAVLDAPVTASAPLKIPSAPKHLKVASVTHDTVTLSWKAGKIDKATPVTEFVIESSEEGGEFTKVMTVGDDVTTAMIGDLVEGRKYDFRVVSQNAAGASKSAAELNSSITPKSPFKKPSSPRKLKASAITRDSVTLTWEAPKSDGGTPVSKYSIEKCLSSTGEFVKTLEVDGSTCSVKLDGLVAGSDYQFRLFAHNEAGTSEAPAELKSPVATKKAIEKPSTPRKLKVSDVTKDSATLSWDAPKSDGGSPVTQYVVEKRTGSSGEFVQALSVDGSTSNVKVDGLTPDCSYEFRVFAQNEAGSSESPAEMRAPVNTVKAIENPSSPRKLKVCDVTKDSATLSWDAPKSDGGSPVTQYVVEKRTSSSGEFVQALSVDGSTSSVKVDGLTPDCSYEFRVFAQNEAGISESPAEMKAAVNTVKAVEKPSSPRKFKVSDVTKDSATLAWDAPKSDGGSPVTQYVVEKRTGSSGEFVQVLSVDGSTCSVKVDGLTPDCSYEFRVFAQNEAGSSESPAEMKAAVNTVKAIEKPAAPCNMRVTSLTADSATLSWDTPDFGVTKYVIEKTDANNTLIETIPLDGSTCEVTVGGLVAGSEYKLQLFAENEAGRSESPAVVPVMGKPAKEVITEKPTSPRNLMVKDVTPGTIELTWDAPEGGTTVQQYIIVMREAQKKKFKKVGKVDGGTLTFSVTSSLEGGHEYIVRVYAENEAGISDIAAEVSSPIMVPVGEVKEEATPATPAEVAKEEHEKVKETPEKKEEETQEEVTKLAEKPKEEVPVTEKVAEKPKEEVPVTEKVAEKPKEEVPVTEKVAEMQKEVPVAEKMAEKVAEKPKEEVPAEAVKEEQEKVKETVSLPSPPCNVSIVKVTGDSIKVAWEAAETQEGTPLKGYVVAVRDAAKKKFKDVGKVDAKTLTFKVKKLKEGHEYFVKVYAESEAGLSEMAAELASPVKVGLPQVQEPSDEVDAAKVQVAAPEITAAPKPSSVKEGDTIKLSCQLKGEENVTVSWSRNGKPVKVSKKDKRVKIGYNSKEKLYFLEIANATLDNAGEYSVTASSDGGQVTSMVAMVTVEPSQKKQKPLLPQLPNAVSVKEGEDIKISCTITASPEPEVKWSKEGKPVTAKDDTRVKITSKEHTYSLRIKQATGTDSGEYTVTAVNSEGTLSHPITVIVEVVKEEEPVAKEEEPVAKEEEKVEKTKLEAKEEEGGPEFTHKPEPIVVEEKEDILILATIKGLPTPTVTWSKDGKPLKPSQRLVESRDGDRYSLRVPAAVLADSGEYTCTANNTGGSAFCMLVVTVEEVDSEAETADKDQAIMEQLSTKIAEAKKKLGKDGGEVVFETYTMLGDYVDKDTRVSLKQGEVVEVMDAESPTGWLVRKHDDKSKICYVPVELLAAKEDRKKGESSDEEEDEKKLKEQAKPLYMAVTDHRPSDTAGLALTEGQIVEVLDWSSADHWLCRLKDDPSTQGLVLPSYLVVSTGDNKLDTRTPQELFREEVIRIKDPAQEAIMKRRYALKDMWESEREYVRDLTFAMDTYYKAFDSADLPKELVGKKTVVFATLPDIFAFHKEKFYNELLECPNDAKSIGETFLRNREGFQNYVTYLRDRDAADRILNLDSTVTFLKELKSGMGKASDSQMALPQYLQRPWKRIDEYINLLKGFIKYSQRAEDDCTQLEEAVKMFLQLRHQADDLMVLQQISGFAGPLDPLGPVLAHDDFIVWDGIASGSGRERHLLLFENNMMVTKKQNATKPGEQPKFTFKQLIPLSDLALNRLEDISPQFALYSTKTDIRTFQAKSVEVKTIWCDLLAKYCKQYESEPEATRPKLLAKLQSLTCDEGETVKFECEVSGEPAPTVTWLHSGQPVSSSSIHKLTTVGNTYTLTVMKADANVAGDYTVKVTNEAGETESNAKLDVRVEEKQSPEFTKKLGKADVLLGGEAKLQCEISGKPEPDITWWKGGKEVVSGDRIKFLFVDDESHALIISEVQESDMGTYKCHAVNKVGEATSSTTLNITDLEERKKECAPQFVASLSDCLVAQDGDVSFRCQMAGYPQSDVIWQYNKKEVKASSRHVMMITDDECVLTVTAVTQDDAGTYTCKLTNKVSHVKSSAVLNVGVTPTLVASPQNLTANVNGEAEMSCRVAGLPRPKVMWLHADKEITASERYELHESEDMFSLKVKDIVEEDAGLYLCRVTNDLGVVESSATMAVTSRAKFINTLQDMSVVSGGEVTLSCDFVCEPCPSVTWLLKGEELKESDSYVFSSDATSCSLRVPVARPDSAGMYTCRLETAAGAEECSAEVTVVAPPVVVSRFSDVECFHAERVEFVCRFSEPVTGQVSWNYNRRAIAPMERIKIEQDGDVCRLIITMAMVSDRGEYICKVENDAGEATCSATLFVMDEKVQEEVDDTDMGVSYKPRFVKRFRDQDAVVGSSARFVCKTIGEPAPHVKWLKDGIPIAPTDNVQLDDQGTLYILSIATVCLEDAGTYECIARNKAGDDTCSAVLSVDDVKEREQKKEERRELTVAPDMPFDKPQLTELEDNVIKLTWPEASLPHGAKSTPIRYVIERKDISHASATWESVQTTEATSVEVHKFDPTKDYLYRLRAENDFGISDPSMSVSYYGKHVTEIKQQMSSKRESRRQKSSPPPVPHEKPHVFVGRGGESVDISWQSMTSDAPIYYIVERRCPPSRNWIEVATDIKDTSYTMTDYQSEKDYMLRVRAANDYGVSNPSPPTTLFAKIDTTVEKKKKEDYKSKVKPRTVWDKPDVVELTDTSVTLSWKSSSLPDYAVQTPISYVLEQRVPPNFEWTRIETDLAETQLKVTKFNRDKDVYFRVRAANEYGTSEPSMPVLIRRREVVEEETKMEKKTKKEEGKEEVDEVQKLPLHKRIPPAFIGTTDDTQYGVEGYTLKVVTTIQGTPRPSITWYHGGEKLQLEGRYNCSLSDMGQVTLEVTHFSVADIGQYKVHVENAFGAAAQIIQVGLADPPTFLEPMKDQIFHLHRGGKLECRVHGIPYPTVQFKKDWRVIADSHRLKITREDYEHWTMNISNVIRMDEGLYECIAENVAGTVYSSATVRVTEKSGRWREVHFSQVPVEDYFHVVDELGRGSAGIVRRVIDKNSGNQYACKFLCFNNPMLKEELQTELEVMTSLDHPNIVQVEDGYEDKKRLAIVMEIVTGGELVPRLLSEDSLTESECAFYLQQVLQAVECMHSHNVVHLDIKPENLFLLSPSTDQLKVIDFGYARRYSAARTLHVKYGTPEFTAPEVAAEEPVTPAADLWSVGVLTYILLSGVSPMYQDTPRETLLTVKAADWQFDEKAFSNISAEAKGFISKLLVKDPRKRMTATDALRHPFINLANHRGLGDKINLDNLRAFLFRRKIERGTNQVKTIVKPVLLSTLLVEPASPAVDVEVKVPVVNVAAAGPDTDAGSVGSLEAGAAEMLQMLGRSSVSSAPSIAGSVSSSEWGREYEDEDTWYQFADVYQSGMDTHLLPTSDTAMSLRMAQYRRTGTRRDDPAARPSMKQRLQVVDVPARPAETFDRFSPVTSGRVRSALWQLKDIADDDGADSQGFPPIFKEKIRDKAYNVGDSCTLRVHLIGRPRPAVSWYRNEELLTDGGRVRTASSDDGHSSLTVLSTKPHDFGVYKCVARNRYGTVTCRARMLLGDHSTRPGRPHVTKVSDREAYMIWEEPESDGNSYITSYRVDWHRPGDERWTNATYCIDECALVKGLRASTTYRFRVAAINAFGTSPYSWASVEIKTKDKGAESINIDCITKKILLRSRQATSRPSPETSPLGSMEDLSELAEKKMGAGDIDREIQLQEIDPETYLEFGSELWRGRFSLIRNVKSKLGGGRPRVVKIIPYDPLRPDDCLRELDLLKAVRQEHIVRLYEGYVWNDFVFLVYEKLFGENVARSLSLKNKYNEYHVTSIIKQVLDACQFLHHRGIVHLNLQPDSVIMVSRRRFEVKIVDFSRSRKITSYDGEPVPREGMAEFMAPEKVAGENVGVAADIWNVGVLAFILLSGVSPFYADSEDETWTNIKSVRYDVHLLYHNVTKYALKFLYQTLRRNPKSRLTTADCLEDRWFQLSPHMVKYRKAALFATDKLRTFEEGYVARRMAGAAPCARLVKAYGSAAAEFAEDTDDVFTS